MYSHRLTIATPFALLDLANSIARSMDPDVGGAESFAGVRALKGNAEYVICDVWVRESFALQAQAMLADPKILSAAVAQDYLTRWPDLTAPTLQACAQFLADSLISITTRDNRPLPAILQPLGLTLIPPSQAPFKE